MKRTYLPDRNAPLRKLTPEECRVSGFPPGTETTATASYDDVIASGPFRLFKSRDRA